MREDQRQVLEALRAVFVGVPVESEWRSLAGERDVYCPRVDVAVGPFATDHRLATEYDRLAAQHHDLLQRLHRAFVGNVRAFDPTDEAPALEVVSRKNRNARCFLAVELEGSGSRKHIMGSALRLR